MSPSTGTPQARIPVIGASGEHLMWVDEDHARQLHKAGEVRIIRRRGNVRILQAATDHRGSWLIPLAGRGTALDHTRYSHRRETETNPPRVWEHSKACRTFLYD